MTGTILYTLGHSDRTRAELLMLLREAGVATLVDVRARPGSTRHPQFDQTALRMAVEEAGMTYHWAGRQLGGLRAGRPGSVHRALPEGLRGFADYMDSEEFKRAAQQLIHMLTREPLAILCAERDPLHCHRSLIADYLVLQGVQVSHLLAPGQHAAHGLRPEARRESSTLIYDRQVTGLLEL
jgi:uncharacterized protein (DUF488 family)